jgi:hypothetical protein
VFVLGVDCASAGPNKSSDNKSHTVEAPHVGGAASAVPHLPGGLGGFHLPGGSEAGGGVHIPGSMAGGGAHIPGSMAGGGAHIPGSMAGGGAHIPGSMAGGGAHIPGSMAGGGAHIPGSMAGGAHVPGSMAAGGAHVPGTMGSGAAHVPARAGSEAGVHRASAAASRDHAEHEPRREAGRETGRPSGAGRGGAEHAERGTTPSVHGREQRPGVATRDQEAGGARAPRIAATPRIDHRLGGDVPMHVNGTALASAPRAAPRRYLHAPEHRDVAADHAFVDRHRGDFHTRNVREFSAKEMHVWRAGLWRNEWHYGRRGWWWEAGGVWYPYADPVFPFPLVVADLTVFDTPTVDGPDLTGVVDAAAPDAGDQPVAEGAPPPEEPAPAPGPADQTAQATPATQATPAAISAPPGIPPLPPAPRGRYSCADPQGDFPGQNACSVPWDFVSNATASTTLETPQ